MSIKRFYRQITISLCCGLGLSLGGEQASTPQNAPPLPVAISVTDPNIRTVGRFDLRDAAGPRCSWPASAVLLKFHGTALNVEIKEAGQDRFQIVVDGKPTSVLETKEGTGVYSIISALPDGPHTVALVKRTEAFVGTPQLLGFQLSAGGKLLSLPPRTKRRIEVIGDSISCGYGNEGKNQYERFSPATENAWLTYGAIAARALGAEYVCLAWSGRKMWPDDTMGEIYDRTLAMDPASVWDFSRWIPDVVVINLATNDFGKEIPDQKAWTGAYEAFIARVRKVYPKAVIYCASGPMMSDSYPPGRHDLTTLKSYLNQIVKDEERDGDKQVHILEFEPQDAKNGLGSDWHPSVKTHEIMAETLTRTLESDLGWRTVER